MEKGIALFIGTIFPCIFFVFFWHKLLNKKIEFKDYKIYSSILIINTLDTIFILLTPQFLKIVGGVIILFIVNYIFFCKNISKNLIMVLYSELIIIISEFIFTLILALFMGDNLDIYATSFSGIIAINIGVTLVAFIITKFKFIYKMFNYLIKTFNNMKNSNLIMYFVITIVLVIIFSIIIHMDLPLIFLLICEAVLTIFYIVMLFRLANAKENYKTVTSKYETSLNSLKEYEEIMDRYRVTNHENKNQLLTIRNMLSKKDTKTINYIDKLVDNKIKDNETIFYKTSKIPEGGLRAIIYSKLCKMKDIKINYELDIANDVKTGELINLEESTMLNACKIIGVFLDNAIEAVEKLKKKQIIIEIFIMDECLCIDISNNYKENIEIDKLGNKKYTTKGKGHGYGLTLVEDIIKSDSDLIHEMKINKELFTQRLKIKM